VENLDTPMSPVGQIRSCGACHDEPADLIGGYLAGEHGKALLVSGLINAPSCSNCHGGHTIRTATDERSPTSHRNAPKTCGTCHYLLLEDWQALSAHGRAWQQGEDGPVCTTCHSSHRLVDPKIAESRLSWPDNCGRCHDAFLTTFRDSFHGQANELGFDAGAVCSDCHTPHKNRAAADPESTVHPDHLLETCGSCHEGVTASFVSFDVHNDPRDPNDSFPVYVVWLFMIGLLVGVFAFFGVHDVLWLQRSLVGKLRGEFAEPAGNDEQHVRRFSKMNIRLHVVVVVTFLVLAATGLPLKFHWMPWAQQLAGLLGGVDTTRLLHRLAAIGTFAYAAFHLGNLVFRWLVRGEKGLFWGPMSLVPQPKDFRDLFAHLRYFFYLGERPQSDRWTYFEKFDYLAVFWGVLIIGLSGLMLWYPNFFTNFLPGWTLNVAHVVHSDEALLATGFIFVFHFFHTHLRPESFPMDLVIFTGKMPLSRFKAERPMEYDRLVAAGRLDEVLVPAPTREEVRKAYILGSIFLIIGIALAVGIIWALLAH
jgi:cytochrome b subunit of formate dehydrogenase